MYLAANVITLWLVETKWGYKLVAVIHTGYSSNGYGKKKCTFLVTKEVLELYKRNTTSNTQQQKEGSK